MRNRRLWKLSRTAVSVAVVLGITGNVRAQALEDVQTANTPLVLEAQGSFFIGGEKVEQTKSELGSLGPGGHVTVNQMYVRYMVPHNGDDNPPVVMVHGATLTGKTWETTPDGRMGWDEYFVRKGHPVYVPDQVGRGRSGFNQAIFNNVRAGSVPPANQPELLRFRRYPRGRSVLKAVRHWLIVSKRRAVTHKCWTPQSVASAATHI